MALAYAEAGQGAPLVLLHAFPLSQAMWAREPEALIRQASPDGVIDALRAMAERRDSTMILPGIRCPVLIIAGEEDALIPAQESRAMSQAIPGARLDIIPHAGHLVNLEQPAAFQRLVASGLLSARHSIRKEVAP